MSFTVVVLALGLISALFVLWIVLIFSLVRKRRFPWSPILLVAAFMLAYLNPAGDAIHDWGFQLAKPSLEAALASGDCPKSAGAYRIKRCTSIGDYRFFVLADTSWDGIDGLVKPTDATSFKPDGVSYPESDGWYFVYTGF